MADFSEVLDAASSLSADEQETLLDILQRRLIEHKRAQLAREIEESRAEFAAGVLRPVTAQE